MTKSIALSCLGAALIATLLTAPLSARATDAEPSAKPFASDEWEVANQRPAPETGRATRGWLQAQGNREQASAQRPTLSGPALRRTHDRYLKSFETDIPQQLRESLPTNK
jgi:Protein of unknown function (DUF3613)